MMKEKLLKQTVACVLIALALFISKNSGIGALERGADTVMSHMEVNYTAKDIKSAAHKSAAAASTVPTKLDKAMNVVTGKPIYGEPIDDKYSGKRASVFSVGGGQVTAVGEDEEIGKYVKITHGSDGESLYGNLSQVFVEVPSKVKRGQIIGVYEKSNDKEFYYSFKEFN